MRRFVGFVKYVHLHPLVAGDWLHLLSGTATLLRVLAAVLLASPGQCLRG
jgi:hypothetical protein